MISPIRTPLRRLYIPGATYFVTAVTHNRAPIFQNQTAVTLLRQNIQKTKNYHPFQMYGYVFLPDHCHLLLAISEQTNISDLIHSIKRGFTQAYKTQQGIKTALQIWQKSFWEHVIRDENDFLKHLDYIHYNPVKHRLIDCPFAYAHSSLHHYSQLKWYEPCWKNSISADMLDYGESL